MCLSRGTVAVDLTEAVKKSDLTVKSLRSYIVKVVIEADFGDMTEQEAVERLVIGTLMFDGATLDEIEIITEINGPF